MKNRDEKRSEQRDRILEAARGLFADRGPEAVTVAEVADAAGVARATVFNHFGSKHALLDTRSGADENHRTAWSAGG